MKEIKEGFRGIYQNWKNYARLSVYRNGAKGDQLRAMMSSAEMPRLVALDIQNLPESSHRGEDSSGRRTCQADMLKKVPWSLHRISGRRFNQSDQPYAQPGDENYPRLRCFVWQA